MYVKPVINKRLARALEMAQQCIVIRCNSCGHTIKLDRVAQSWWPACRCGKMFEYLTEVDPGVAVFYDERRIDAPGA